MSPAGATALAVCDDDVDPSPDDPTEHDEHLGRVEAAASRLAAHDAERAELVAELHRAVHAAAAGGAKSTEVARAARLDGSRVRQLVAAERRRRGVEVPDVAEARARAAAQLTRRYLRSAYVRQGKSIRRIARETGHAPATVVRYLDLYGLRADDGRRGAGPA